ncbi:MAG TPA: MobF family relaxase [Opitutaceae bacterium]|nr:MobF family relaxase [Opitutaceae bacterium]
MISPKAQFNLKVAREYYRQHLAGNDYYSQKKSIAGEWLGEGAVRLKLVGPVAETAFLALCEGNHPETGELLTQRRNSVRRENGVWTVNRRVFYDWTMSPPKSVSVVALLQDDRIIEAHARAVRVACKELEAFAETRVRLQGKREERVTGNIVTACFRHETSRELDPHLHTHCVVFNATFDPVENRWKALETHGMLKAQRFAASVYDHELCRDLRALGYKLRRNGRSFEIEGVPVEVTDRFSKRRRQIDDETAKRVAREGLHGNLAEIRDQVAHNKRRRKIKESTADRLRASWFEQLNAGERSALEALRNRRPAEPEPKVDLAALLSWSERHVFERKSVVPKHELIAAALVRGRGQSFSLAAVRETLERMPMIFTVDSGQVTSKELVELETSLVSIARKTVRTEGGFNFNFRPDISLSDEQRRAVAKILESYSFLTLFRGPAGSGKSRTLREIKRGLEEANRTVLVLAPQRQQVLDLEADGLPAQTLAQFLVVGKIPERATVLLDEASQVGIRDLHRLVLAARDSRARLILSGDTRQHGAVAASDALILLERYAGLPVAKLKSIRRQDPRLAATAEGKRAVAVYRSAVKLASQGKAGLAFDKLDGLGWIHEHRSEENRELLARNYLLAAERAERALIVAQTWSEVDAVNLAVRTALREQGHLGPAVELVAYRAVDLTVAEKQDPGSYFEGTKVFFLKCYGRYKRGDVCPVACVSTKGLTLLKDGRRATLAFRYAERLAVLKEKTLEVSPGDRLQLKWNGRSLDDQPLVNGELVTVSQVYSDGRIGVETDRGRQKVLGPSQRLFNYGYACTSYASQGKTVDTVLFSDAGSKPATNQKQWFVTISRARRRALIFTSDKWALRAAIASDGHRMLATEASKDGQSVAKFHRAVMQETASMPMAASESVKTQL